MESHTINPSLSLSAPANSPLQQQMRQDYATGLLGAQRDLLEQNPSGLGRQEQAIGRELNGYIGPRRQSSARTAGDFANPSELRLIGKPSLGCAQY